MKGEGAKSVKGGVDCARADPLLCILTSWKRLISPASAIDTLRPFADLEREFT